MRLFINNNTLYISQSFPEEMSGLGGAHSEVVGSNTRTYDL